MRSSCILAVAALALLAGCGKMADLEPAAGQSLPAKPLMARTTPTADDLLTPPPYAKPERVDENAKAAELRLDAATLARIDELARPGLARGGTLV